MPGRRLGCISGAGLIAALVTLLLTSGFVLVRGGSLFTPGPLNAQVGEETQGGIRSHAETGGRCEACHTPPWSAETLADRCLACHAATAAELTDPASLHGALKVQQTADGCRLCHTEHRGATAGLTVIDPVTFPHDATGYALTGHRTLGSGQSLACADCHPQTVAEFVATTCDTCHRQADAAYMEAHTAAFGADCLACHDGADRYGRRAFDHGKVFPLTGKHAAAACAGCHPAARSVADLQAAPQTCVGCHQKDDKHKGAFGADCGACHKTDTWQGATFDHSKSAFPLTGKHVQVDCAQCHVNNVYKGTPQTCVDCHKDPVYHLGVFSTACADCHTANAWRPAKYNRPHTFPYDHGESGVSPCQTCHPAKINVYTCYSCHEHTETKIAAKHRDEGITDFANCMKCHPTGREEEGKGGRDD